MPERALLKRGYRVARLRDLNTFVRLQVDSDETLLVDLCLDSPPVRPPVHTSVGLTFAPEELAGRKVVALFSRAEARAFLDVYALLRRFDRSTLLKLAWEIDRGFDLAVFADMLHSVDRHTDTQTKRFRHRPRRCSSDHARLGQRSQVVTLVRGRPGADMETTAGHASRWVAQSLGWEPRLQILTDDT